MAPRRDDPSREVEEQLESLGDPETSSPLPSGALAAGAGWRAREARRRRRRRTDREIWGLAWPVILSQVMVSAGALVDVAMVGRLSRDAVAAVGYATQFQWLTQSALFAVGIACVALMARSIGAGRPEQARAAFASALAGGTALAGAVAAAALLAPAALLRALQAQDAVVALGIPYLQLTLGSTPLLAVAIVIESALRADRDTRTPMRIALAANAVKVVGNALLIFGLLGLPRLELVGAGIATVLSQLTALGLFVAVIRRRGHRSPVRLGRRDLAGAGARLPEVTRLALPAVAERVVMNGAMMAYFIFIGRYGTAAIAAYTIGIRMLSFSWIPGIGFSQASATLVGQALGARDPDAAGRAAWRAVAMALAVSVGLGAFFALARGPMARAFTGDAGVVAELGPFMLILALTQPLMGMHFTLAGALRGAGDTVTPLVAATVGNWAFRVPVAFLCAAVLHTGVIWLWCALVLDHAARALWLLAAFQRGRWKERVGT